LWHGGFDFGESEPAVKWSNQQIRMIRM
jgi:hypothetical protein